MSDAQWEQRELLPQRCKNLKDKLKHVVLRAIELRNSGFLYSSVSHLSFPASVAWAGASQEHLKSVMC